MNNVEVADKMVHALMSFQKEFETKPFVMVPHRDCAWYIKGLERLRMVEKHLYNLTGRAYDEPITAE